MNISIRPYDYYFESVSIIMKKLGITLIALILCVTLAALAPAQAMAAADGETLYVSEVKIGMGADSQEAVSELLAEGYKILLDKNGDYSNLNQETGTGSGMKEGPTQKVVYLGYKTTTDPKEAITDLAVMNMNGGYSTEDYNKLMNDYMDGQIKPFVDRFISTLEEYRANYAKPADSLGHKRADYYRKLLNMLTDDDTGDKPIGDLLLNKTKYELGDDAYNALSDEEKKNHADILTLLTQANGHAVMMIETLLARSADTSDDTWIDRIGSIDLDALKDQIKEDDPSLTTEADVTAALDKEYYDVAMKLIGKQENFIESVNDTESDDKENELNNKEDKTDELKEKLSKLSEDISEEEAASIARDILEAEADMVTGGALLENMVITEYLDVTDYGDDTLLEFFEDNADVYAIEKVRRWYPIAASLSEGQTAALDFLSLKDLIAVAITDEAGYQDPGVDKIGKASVYQDVDRAIYEPGGVALTNATLRNKKNAAEDLDNTDFSLSKEGITLWVCTGITAAGLGATAIAAKVIGSMEPAALTQRVADITAKITNAKNVMEATVNNPFYIAHPEFVDTLQKSARNNIARNTAELVKANDALEAAKADIAARSSFCKYLAAGFAVVTALLAGLSIYKTITELLEYYKVTFVPIPKYIVEEADITEYRNGEKIVVRNDTAYYKVVQCNRKPGDSEVERTNYSILGTANDLNGDVGKQWLALYSVKYENGRPILAKSLKVVKGSPDLPSGYETGIHRFGESAAFNLTSKLYCYNDTPDGTYVYYKHADIPVEAMAPDYDAAFSASASTSASIGSGGSMAIGAGVGAVLGGLAVALVVLMMRKKKGKEA